MLYRYELAVDGELQGVGFLVGLNELEDGGRAERALAILDKALKNPSASLGADMGHTASFFTEEGEIKFQDIIQEICAAYENTLFGICRITVDETMLPSGCIRYEDRFQKIVGLDALEGIAHKEDFL